jgi:hypothetical protein
MIAQWRAEITEANDLRAETQGIVTSDSDLDADHPAVAEGSSSEGDQALTPSGGGAPEAGVVETSEGGE